MAVTDDASDRRPALTSPRRRRRSRVGSRTARRGQGSGGSRRADRSGRGSGARHARAQRPHRRDRRGDPRRPHGVDGRSAGAHRSCGLVRRLALRGRHERPRQRSADATGPRTGDGDHHAADLVRARVGGDRRRRCGRHPRRRTASSPTGTTSSRPGATGLTSSPSPRRRSTPRRTSPVARPGCASSAS